MKKLKYMWGGGGKPPLQWMLKLLAGTLGPLAVIDNWATFDGYSHYTSKGICVYLVSSILVQRDSATNLSRQLETPSSKSPFLIFCL